MKDGFKYYSRKLKLFEEYMDEDYELSRIMKELEKRAYSWFNTGDDKDEKKGRLGDAQLVDIKQSETEVSTRKSLIIEFNDNEFYFQLIIRVYIEDLNKSDLILKKYSPVDNGLNLVDQLSLTGENKVDTNDIKGKFIEDQIIELNGKNKNPDENDIEIPKTDEKPPEGGSPSEGGTEGVPPPEQGGPPVQGGMPAQAGGPPPVQPTL